MIGQLLLAWGALAVLLGGQTSQPDAKSPTTRPRGRTAQTRPDPDAGSPHKVAVDFYPFVTNGEPAGLPDKFTVFYGMLAHSSGKIYVGACYHIAKVVEFDPATKRSRLVATLTSQAKEGGGPDLADPVLKGDRGTEDYPGNRWVYGQDKIHAQMHEGADGRVYSSTHVRVEYADLTRDYPGGHWFAYDPKTGATEDLGWGRRHEGIITCAMDVKRNVLYGITWPTGYLLSCKPDEKNPEKRMRVLGLTSSHIDCSPRYMGVVADGRVYCCDGATGQLLVYKQGELYRIFGLATPGSGRRAPATQPEANGDLPGWHNWWMTGTTSPDGMRLFLTSQRGGRLTEIDATRGRWGTVIDHGRLVPWGPTSWGGSFCGIMVFARDGLLYHTVGKRLLSFDPQSGKVMDLGQTVLRTNEQTIVPLHGGGVLGRDGLIYASARVGDKSGLAVLDPAKLDLAAAKLLRVSPREVFRSQ